jgi:hypothetical protein
MTIDWFFNDKKVRENTECYDLKYKISENNC